MKTRLLTSVYFIIGLAYIATDYYPVIIPREVLKALIIPILMVILLINVRLNENKMHGIMLAGLFFSWAGDIILGIPGNNPGIFIAGLASFLLAHIMYFTVFFITPGENVITDRRSYLLIPVIVTGIALVGYLYKDLNGMRFPVIMYTTVILTMVAGAINRIEKVNRTSYWLVLAGAILFLISDSTIAVNKFSHPFRLSELAIMSTYIAAQYLIVTGYIRQFSDSRKNILT
jgi:uncharacterized membrane protein YhhN